MMTVRQMKTTGGWKAHASGQRPAAAQVLAPHSMPATILNLQRTVGNRLVQRLVRGPAPSQPTAGRSRSLFVPTALEPMQDDGKSGVGPVGQELVETAPQESSSPEQLNEEGLLDGELGSGVYPRVFTNSGKSGSSAAWFAGGAGGQGDQDVGSITVVAPTIESADPPAAGGTATAWVTAGTGTATVTRSFTGVLTGRNSADWYITAMGAARVDKHERLHIASTKGHHDTHIKPLETRVAARTGVAKALSSGATKAAAASALVALLKWNASITSFTNADTTANTPGGPVDTADQATADSWRDYGPRAVGGVNYAHYADTPPGP